MNKKHFQKTEHAGICRLVDCLSVPVRIIGNEAILQSVEAEALRQANNIATLLPGVTDVTLTPDAHVGYGCPVGCVVPSQTHVYPGLVGVDVGCSVSLLQIDLDAKELESIEVRKRLIKEIEKRVSAADGANGAPLRREFRYDDLRYALTCGMGPFVAERFGFDKSYLTRFDCDFKSCDDKRAAALEKRLDEFLLNRGGLQYHADQLGSYGGGNHFGECQRISIVPEKKEIAEAFGLVDGRVGFMSHCGSRGFGARIARQAQNRLIQKFEKWDIPFPAGDRNLVYAPLDSQEAEEYYDDMTLASTYAALNHAVINSLVAEAFQAVFPGVESSLIYCISHNNARYEVLDGRVMLVCRKGATRAYPARHFALKGSPFYETGHPILLPGDPIGGSSVMVAEPGAEKSRYSVNHGSGRALSRGCAKLRLQQEYVDSFFLEADVVTNQKNYPVDEAPDAYKNFDDVLQSVVEAGLASEVARLKALFVLKDASDLF